MVWFGAIHFYLITPNGGNKRIALFAGFTYLQTNGHYLISPLHAVRFLVEVVRNKAQTEEKIDELN